MIFNETTNGKTDFDEFEKFKKYMFSSFRYLSSQEEEEFKTKHPIFFKLWEEGKPWNKYGPNEILSKWEVEVISGWRDFSNYN